MKKDIDNTNLLDRIVGTNKKSDLFVLQQLIEGYTHREISRHLRITRSRVTQIADSNRDLLDELTLKATLAIKAGHIRKAIRFLRGKDKSKKDPIDILDYMRKEMRDEGRHPIEINIISNIPTTFDNTEEKK